MKRIVAILLALCLCIGISACSGTNGEEVEVKNYLTKNSWHFGDSKVSFSYQFNADGTYIKTTYIYAMPSSDEGTYKINTRKQTITLHEESSGTKYVLTYSLYEHSMKLFSENATEYKAIRK